MLVTSPLKLNEAEIRSFSEKYVMSLESEYIGWFNIINNTPIEIRCKLADNREFNASDLLAEYPNPKVLEVGCGAYPAGSISPEEGHTISMTCCDVLAIPYSILHSYFGIKPYVNIDFSFVERLSDRYEANSFDIVRMSNALDHCYDPFSGIFEMLKVTRVGGTLRLSHFENESERELEYGMHQWNITADGADSMVIWQKDFRADIRDVLGEAVNMKTKMNTIAYKGNNARVITTDIVKLTDIETPAKRGMNIFDETFITFCLMNTSPRFSSAYRKNRKKNPFRKSLFRKLIAYAPMKLRKYVPSWLERSVRKLARSIGY